MKSLKIGLATVALALCTVAVQAQENNIVTRMYVQERKHYWMEILKLLQRNLKKHFQPLAPILMSCIYWDIRSFKTANTKKQSLLSIK